jgi:hypothetical protein
MAVGRYWSTKNKRDPQLDLVVSCICYHFAPTNNVVLEAFPPKSERWIFLFFPGWYNSGIDMYNFGIKVLCKLISAGIYYVYCYIQ